MTSGSVRYLYATVAALALSACAAPGGDLAPLSCSKKDCPVPIEQKFLYANLQVAEKVIIDGERPVTIVWTLTVGGGSHARFHPTKGIEFTSPGFECAIDPMNDLVYKCIDNAQKGEHKYSIKLVGFGAPPTKDPFVVNN